MEGLGEGQLEGLTVDEIGIVERADSPVNAVPAHVDHMVDPSTTAFPTPADLRDIATGKMLCQIADKKALSFVPRFFAQFAQVLETRGITHLDLNQMRTRRALFFAKLHIITEILAQPADQRPKNFSMAKVMEALKTFHKESLEGKRDDFFALVRDSIPAEAKDLMLLAILIGSNEKIEDRILWMSCSQLEHLTTLLTEETETDTLRHLNLGRYWEESTDLGMLSGVQDIDKLVRHTASCDQCVAESLTPDLEQITRNCQSKILVIKEKASPASRKKAKDLYRLSLSSISGELSLALPKKINGHMKTLQVLRTRISAIMRVIKELPMSQANDHILEVCKLLTLMQKEQASIRKYLISLKVYLADSALLDSVEEVHKIRRAATSEFMHAYKEIIESAIIDIALQIAKDRHGDKSLSKKEFSTIVDQVSAKFYMHLAARKLTGSNPKQKKLAEKIPESKFDRAIKEACNHLFAVCKEINATEFSLGNETTAKALRDEKSTWIQTKLLPVFIYMLPNMSNGPSCDVVEHTFTEGRRLTAEEIKEKHARKVEDSAIALPVQKRVASHATRDALSLATVVVMRDDLYKSDAGHILAGFSEQGIQLLDKIESEVCSAFDLCCFPLSMMTMQTARFTREDATLVVASTTGDFESMAEIAEREEQEQMQKINLAELMADIEEEQKAQLEAEKLKKAKREASSVTREENIEPTEEVRTKKEKEVKTEVSVDEVQEEQAAEADEDVQVAWLPCMRRVPTIQLLGRVKLSPVQICKAESQIYLRQSLSLAAHILGNPGHTKALLPALLESVHLAIEQGATAVGITSQGKKMNGFTSHELATRMRECGLAGLCGRAQRLMTSGTINARYPYMNAIGMRRNRTLVANILRQVQASGTIQTPELLQLISELNGILAIIQGQDEPEAVDEATLAAFSESAAPLPIKVGIRVGDLMQLLANRFTTPSQERDSMFLLLEELEAMVHSINEMGGIPKPLIGAYLHNLYRITQYTLRNILTIRYREIHAGHATAHATPVRLAELGKAIGLDSDICGQLNFLDMRKGLDYPLGRRSERPLDHREKMLLHSHYSSMTAAGFQSAVKIKGDEEILAEFDEQLIRAMDIINLLI